MTELSIGPQFVLQVLVVIVAIILGLIFIYIILRVGSAAIFRSYFECKRMIEGGGNHETKRTKKGNH